MRLVDVDVLADEMGSFVPPLEVRLDLQPGDKVGLYEQVRDASLGAGYSPIEAIVLGSTEPGWFVGETEDGREISFHAGNVADIELGSPSMGGMFDWFKKIVPPLPGSVPTPPPPPPSRLPVIVPEQRQETPGLLSKLKSLLPSSQPAGGGPKTSIFDIFKQQPGLPVQREAQQVVVAEKKESFFSVLSPSAPKTMAPFSKIFSDLALPKGPNPLTPYIEKFKQVFKIIPKTPEPEPKKEGQMTLWEGMFEEAKPEEERPFTEVFTMFRPEEVQPTKEVLPPNLPKTLHREMKILPMPRRTTLFPSVEDVARGLLGWYNPVDELWEMLREARSKPAWAKYKERYGFAKEKFESIGTCGGPPTVFQEVSSLLHIPWEEFRKRAKIVERGESEEWVDDEIVWEDIVFPATELLTEAFNLIKPPDLPGTFSFEREVHGDTFCMLVATYTEGQEREGAYEDWKRDNNLESPEEVVAGLKRDRISRESAVRQMDNEIKQLEADIANLDKSSGTYQDDYDEIASMIQYRKEISDAIMADASEEIPPEEPPDLAQMVQEIEQSIATEEKEQVKLFETLENLNPNDPHTKALREELKTSMEKGRASLKALMEELSKIVEIKESQEPEEEEKAKRTPSKPKKRKKGK